MMSAILGNTGFFVGIGVEAFVILVCGALLVLMLTGVLFKWLAQGKVVRTVKAEAKAAAGEARAVAEEEAAAQAAAEEEAERAAAEVEAAVKAEAEAAAAEAAAVAAEKKAKEDAAKEAEEKAAYDKAAADKAAAEKVAAEKAAEEKAAAEAKATAEKAAEEKAAAEAKASAEANSGKAAVQQPAAAAEAAATAADTAEDEESEDEDGRDFVVVHDGIVFNDSKTITELYEELSPEQQSYFDELREEALTKPDAELAISKNFVSVKIGKRNLIKLLIKRGVTVAEFMLENDALKQLRLSNTNKRGKSTIKVKPTVVQVLDLTSLKVAVDMINLSYEELMLGD